MTNPSKNQLPLQRDVFEARFVAYLIERSPCEQVVYGKRVKDYAAGVVAAYWRAYLEDGHPPEQFAAGDMEYWPVDHGMECPLRLGQEDADARVKKPCCLSIALHWVRR